MALLTVEEPRLPEPKKLTLANHPLWKLGFRPFYLLGTLFATISIPLWIAQYLGVMRALPNVGLAWHMHEMVFGFAIAIIVGFILTAARNWTGLWTARREQLAGFAALWLAGRLAMLFAHPLVAALIDVVFIPLAAWSIYKVLHRAGSTQNMILVAILSLITLANIAFHLAVLEWAPIQPVAAMQAAILLIVTLEFVVGGRLIPSYTSGAVPPGVKVIVNARYDQICLWLTALAGVAWIIALPAPLVAALAFAASGAQLIRLAGWKPHHTFRRPILWVLHLAYAWIPIGFFLLALAAIGVVPSSAGFHALGVGAIAGLIIGMITRTALGHTGRQIKARGVEITMYVLIQLGAVSRVCASIHLEPDLRQGALLAATILWTAAFLLFVVVYGPYFFRARIDGKEG
ncbi:MAG TPA: NnrS family protein [Burkholderiaceae bacterium]|nr:NnrS family protein [Burkholderiaceae bacterium]